MDLVTFTHMIAMSLHRVGLAGACVDMKTFHELGQTWTKDAAKLRDRVTKYALKNGLKQFSPTNDAHCRELLFDKLGCEVINRTRGGEIAVDKNTLKRMMEEQKGDLGKDTVQWIRDFIAFNSADKLASTWYGKPAEATAHTRGRKSISVASLLQPLDASGKKQDLSLLHFWVFPLRTRTGRRASGGGEEGDPQSRNSQNWPPAARRVIRSRWRRSKIAICDFSRLEVVLVAWLAGDEKLLHYFQHGDGYAHVARQFWNQEVVKDTPLYKATKAMVLGLNYNMGAWHLAMDLKHKAGFTFSEDWDEHVKQTAKARKRYLKEFAPLKRFIKDRIREATRTQQIVSPSGRVRHFPHHGPDSEGFWHIKNQSVNYAIQSFASDVTGGSIVDYEEAMLREHKLSYREWHRCLLESPADLPCSPVINEVHDELDVDMHPRTGKRDLEILRDAMENCRTLKKLVPAFKDIKLKVDIQQVQTWGDAT
jgi:DNA polymerase I-like protein with 3'-5' exonuclease and polymerase domains